MAAAEPAPRPIAGSTAPVARFTGTTAPKEPRYRFAVPGGTIIAPAFPARLQSRDPSRREYARSVPGTAAVPGSRTRRVVPETPMADQDAGPDAGGSGIVSTFAIVVASYTAIVLFPSNIAS